MSLGYNEKILKTLTDKDMKYISNKIVRTLSSIGVYIDLRVIIDDLIQRKK